MSSRASLELSKKIFELVGEYDTERFWIRRLTTGEWVLQNNQHLDDNCVPAPTFAEIVRVLPKIGEKKKITRETASYSSRFYSENLVYLYMSEKTEPEGMKAVEDYLMKLL